MSIEDVDLTQFEGLNDKEAHDLMMKVSKDEHEAKALAEALFDLGLVKGNIITVFDLISFSTTEEIDAEVVKDILECTND